MRIFHSKRTLGLALVSIIVLALASGCRESAQPTISPQETGYNLDMSYEPDPAVVGASIVVVTVTDNDGNAVDVEEIVVRGDMNHAGMQPVIGTAAEGTDGVYRVPFEWTMGGEWIVTVTATLTDETEISDEFTLDVASAP
jgi:hypothetical protein